MFSLRRYLFQISPIFVIIFLVSGALHVFRIRLTGYQIDIVTNYLSSQDKVDASSVFINGFILFFSLLLGIEVLDFLWNSLYVWLYENFKRKISLKYEKKFLNQLQFLSALKKDWDSENMKLFSKFRYDLTNLILTRYRIFIDISQNFITIFIILVQLFLIHYWILLFTLPIFLSILIPLFSEKRLTKKRVEISKARREFVSIFEESINSFQTLIFNGKEQLLAIRSRQSSNRFLNLERGFNLRRDLISSLQSQLQSFLAFLIVVIALGLSLKGWAFGGVTIGSIAIVFTYFRSIINHAQLAISDLLELKSTKPIERLLALPKEIEVELQTSNFPTSIEAKNISLQRSERELFGSLSFLLKVGKGYLLTGESGAGKTTLLNLIMGLIQDYQGCLFLDGIDYKKIPEFTLRENIASMPALNQIFKGNVQDNITLWDQKVDFERYQKSLRISNLERELKDKETTIVNCEELSEGQRQRVALARAFYLDRPILLLDEPFANLDKKNVNIIIKRLLEKKILKGRLIVISSHTDIEILSTLLERIHIENKQNKTN